MADLILNPESEVVIFFGPKGKGKSSLMAHFADDYLKTQGPKRQELSEQLIREENALREIEQEPPLSFPIAPPMYSNTVYNLTDSAGRPFKPIPIKGKDIGISNDKEDYKALFPASLIVLDEAHREFCTKGKGENLPDGQFEYFMECRHDRIIMLLAAPRAVLINKDIRASGSRFIEPRKVINEFDDFKRLYKTTWYCREFLETSAIEEYISTNGKSDGYVETTYVHNGNVRELYDGYAFRRRFYPKKGKDFETYH